MAEVWRALGHYRLLVAVAFRCSWQYRTSLLLLTVAEIAATALDLAAIGIVFANTGRLAGFGFTETAFLYGTAALSFALAEGALGQVERLGWGIRKGDADIMLVRPMPVLVQAAAAEFSPQRLGRILQPAAVVGISLTIIDVDWTPARVALVPAMVACGTIIAASLAVAGAAVLFVAPDASIAVSAVGKGANQASQYPMTIYGRHLLMLLTFVVPVAFVNWQPALYVLDVPDPLGLPAPFRFAGPAVALLAAAGAAWAWRTGVRHYRSTGS